MLTRHRHNVDVAVLGAGSAGCASAIAAARAGARTIIVDRLGFLGGTSTAVLDTFYGFFTAGEAPTKVVSGIPDEPVARLRDRGKLFERPNSFGSGLGYTYDPESLKIVWAELLREAGVAVVLHGLVADTRTVDGVIESVDVITKAGLLEIRAAAFVDATGDADVCAHSGATFLTDTELTQPATLTFRVAPVETAEFQANGRPRFSEYVSKARASGRVLVGDGGSLHRSGIEGVVLTALTRVDPPRLDDPLDSGRPELEALEQVDEWARFLRDFVPGFERAEIVSIGAIAGVRETRRVVGRYVLQETDVLEGRSFPDQVALCGAPIEDLSALTTRWAHVGGEGVYGIPLRCLAPIGLANVVVAGRCLSASHAAHASARSMATCMALGQAAGLAAATVVRTGGSIGAVDPAQLRDRLVEDGASVGQRVFR